VRSLSVFFERFAKQYPELSKEGEHALKWHTCRFLFPPQFTVEKLKEWFFTLIKIDVFITSQKEARNKAENGKEENELYHKRQIWYAKQRSKTQRKAEKHQKNAQNDCFEERVY